MSSTHKINLGTLRSSECYIEAIELHYSEEDHGPECAPWVTVWAYANIIRYDLWWQTSNNLPVNKIVSRYETSDSAPYEGKTKTKPPKHRYKLLFKFENNDLDQCYIKPYGRLTYLPRCSNDIQICKYVSSSLKKIFKNRTIYLN